MTDNNGAVDLSAGNASGNGEGQGNAGNNSDSGSQGGTPDFFASLSEDNKAFLGQKGVDAPDKFDLNKVLDMHRNADTLISKGAHKQTGGNGSQGDGSEVPANPAGYEFKMPDGMPDGMPYDKDFANSFAQFAHNKGIPKSVASAVHDFYVEQIAGQYSSSMQQGAEQFEKAAATTFDTLTKEWGGADTPGFQRNLELAQRAMKNVHSGFKEALINAGVVKVDGGKEIVTDPSVMLGLQKVGATMFAEDSEWGGKPSTENPFDPKTQNLTRQGDMVRDNPELAKQLIRAAGQEQYWGHFLNK